MIGENEGIMGEIVRVIQLEGADNVRDLGGIPVSDRRAIAPGLFFRGSALHSLTDADRKILQDDLGVTCVIDLRCGWERDERPNVPIPTIESLHIPFYDKEIVGIEYTEPAAGTKVIGRDIACDPLRFYRSLANELTVGQMRLALHTILERAMEGKAVYFHCSGGKDRAGIMAFLLLIALGAQPDAILQDYLLTNVSRDEHYPRSFRRFLKFADGDEQRAQELINAHRARPENLTAFHDAICQQYGSMRSFMQNQLALTDELRMTARRACTTATSEAAIGDGK